MLSMDEAIVRCVIKILLLVRHILGRAWMRILVCLED